MFGSWLLLAAAHSADPSAFEGRWMLDGGASDPIAPLLDASGAPWWERAMADRLQVTQDIRVRGNTVVIDVDSGFFDQTETLSLDAAPRSLVNRHGRPMQVWSRMDEQAFVTEFLIDQGEGRTARLELRRTVEDQGATMRQRLVYTTPDGQRLEADRLFRRI